MNLTNKNMAYLHVEPKPSLGIGFHSYCNIVASVAIHLQQIANALLNIHPVQKRMEPLVLTAYLWQSSTIFRNFWHNSSRHLHDNWKNVKSTITTCTTLHNDDVSLTSSERVRWRGVHLAATVASKFTRFKSGWLQYCKTRITDLESWRSQTSHQHGCCSCEPVHIVIFQLVSRRAMVISSTAFSSDIVLQWSPQPLKPLLTSRIERTAAGWHFCPDFLAAVSYDVVHATTV